MDNQQDNHRFGESDYANANDYRIGQMVKYKCLQFLGRRDYQAFGGEKDRTGFYKVLDNGMEKELRFSTSNEITAKKNHNITEYRQLEGKWLVFQVKKYNQGNGFVLINIQNQEIEEPKKEVNKSGKLV